VPVLQNESPLERKLKDLRRLQEKVCRSTSSSVWLLTVEENYFKAACTKSYQADM
jgi:hypothetical protein